MKSYVISLAAPVDYMKRILSSNWLTERTNRVRNFWKLPGGGGGGRKNRQSTEKTKKT